ncbi:MAG: D-tyrosyl-tRNA(Tyr) deacylase [Bacteroidales bacterium]|nr:D-tyrosyl-tRNA(Tyr) deacylase [Bacteroidales bacterium]
MRAVIQRVTGARIAIDHARQEEIGKGLVVLVGIEAADGLEDIAWLSGKISRLRIFPDPDNVMNLSVTDVGGEVMIVSQFTLHASTKKGNRPSYIRAAPPEKAIPVYEKFIERMEQDTGRRVVTGEFGAYMQIDLINDGPVTIFIDTRNRE